MDTGATIILVAGLGVAGFLYYRSQQQQAAALAAAQAAQGPGVLKKLENTVGKYGSLAWNAVSHVPGAAVNVVGSFAGGVASGANSVVGLVKGIF